jgi:hypothetical protein
MHRGEISIAERLACIARLKPDRRAREQLWKALHAIEVEPRAPLLRTQPPPTPSPAPAVKPSLPAPPHSLPPATVGKAHESRPFELHELARDEGAVLPWPWESEPALPGESSDYKSPPFDLLLPPLARTAILAGALSMRAREGEVDLPEVVETLARGQPLKHLPRLPVPTLRRGIQLLVDVGEGMLPFARDRAELVEAIQHLVPRTELKMFVGCPSRGSGSGARSQKGWPRWRPPARGTPVVLLSDLGLGGPQLSLDRALSAEWLAFCARARRAGCPLVAFVPYERQRWPRPLARAMILVTWDRGTTAGQVRHAVGPGLEVER